MMEEAVESRTITRSLGRLKDLPSSAVDPLRHVTVVVRFMVDQTIIAQLGRQKSVIATEKGVTLLGIGHCVRNATQLAFVAARN